MERERGEDGKPIQELLDHARVYRCCRSWRELQVLLDYRGLDTLGEVSVLFTAVTGVLLLFRTLKGREEIS